MHSALLLFQAHPFCFDSAGYLAHLSIELLFKALLLGIKDEFPDQHDLRGLFASLQKEVPGTKLTRRGEYALDMVNTFGQLRYPRPRQPIEVGNDELDLIVSLYNSVFRYVPVSMRPVEDPEGWVTKHGGRILMRRKKSGRPKALQPTSRVRTQGKKAKRSEAARG